MYHSLPVACQNSQCRQSDRHTNQDEREQIPLLLQAYFDLLYDPVTFLWRSRTWSRQYFSPFTSSSSKMSSSLMRRGCTSEKWSNNIKWYGTLCARWQDAAAELRGGLESRALSAVFIDIRRRILAATALWGFIVLLTCRIDSCV
jgi:hypothetical protein